MARPGIAKKLVEIARKENAVAICHGATGKGNDQIRFELGIKALAPDIKIIAPWRDDKWQMDSREAEIAYCKAHGIDLPFGTDQSYSRDRNLWHISHEGLELENPANEPNYDHLLVLGVSPEKAPDEGEYVTMTFEKGVPKTVNGKEMKVSDIIRELNRLGGKHGVGIIDIVENRVVYHDQLASPKQGLWDNSDNLINGIGQTGNGMGMFEPYFTFKPFAQTMLDLLTDENGVLLDEAAKKAYQNYGY